VADGGGLLDRRTLHPMHSEAVSRPHRIPTKASAPKRCTEFNLGGGAGPGGGVGPGGVVNENIWSKWW